MIPDSIRIDDNGDFEIEVNGFHGVSFTGIFTFKEIEKAYLLANSKRNQQIKSEKHACYVNFEQSKDEKDIYDTCCLETDPSDCTFAEGSRVEGKCKTECQYWRPIEVKK